jgi:phosphotransferase system enzyme I (PtsI)
VIRTLDAGGDKLVSDISATDEANPFMGWRSIRVCLDRKDLFKEQLKALLLASKNGNLRIMFPMISGLQELRAAKTLYQECRDELTQQGMDLPDIKVGAMIEVPAAVMMVDAIAKEVDFFSIGTNDLIQFTLAVDRTNELIANMFEPHHPAVLNMIDRIVTAAHREGIIVSVCGEMSSDPLSTLVLVGLDVDELSMTPWSIMECKKIIRSINYEDVRATAKPS